MAVHATAMKKNILLQYNELYRVSQSDSPVFEIKYF